MAAGLDVSLGADGDAGGDAGAGVINRALAVAAVMASASGPSASGQGRLVTLQQVHSAVCVVAGEWDEASRLRADALVSDRPGLVLGILTADCAPVLLADRAANDGRGVIGAAHAGWKGALAGVTEATVAMMEALGARRERIVAAIGPCIAQASYEVDEGFALRFREADEGGAAPASFFAPGRAGHWQFDLSGYVAHRLRGAGVGVVEQLGLDTYGDAARFFSFRRATHRGEAGYGRQISLIGLPE